MVLLATARFDLDTLPDLLRSPKSLAVMLTDDAHKSKFKKHLKSCENML
jgi:hypothetical protein